MTSLIALISSGKGTWTQVISLIKSQSWEKIFIICNSFSYDAFNISLPNLNKLKFDEKNIDKSLSNLSQVFKKEIKDLEVALNITSGSGIEHMALVTAVLRSGLGIRFVYSKQGHFKEFALLEGPQEEVF